MNRLYCIASLILLLWTSSFGQDYQWKNWTVEDGLSNAGVNHILQDSYGLIWIATEHGLNRFDGYNFTIYRYSPFDKNSIGANYIEHVKEDKEGNIWAALSVGGLSKWNRTTNQFTYYGLDSNSTQKNSYVEDMIWDSDGRMLFTLGHGLYTLGQESTTFRRIYPKEEKTKSPLFNWVFEDLQKKIWLYGRNHGLGQLGSNADSFQIMKYHFDGEDFNVPNDWEFHKPFMDSRKRLWLLGKQAGVFLYDVKLKRLKPFWRDFDLTFAYEQIVNGFFETSDGRVWASLKRYGLFYFDEQKHQFIRNEIQPKSWIKNAFRDSLDQIWLNLEDGNLALLNKHGISKISNKVKYLTDVLIDKDNGIWLGSRSSGISYLKKKHWGFQHWTSVGSAEKKLGYTRAILQDRDGAFWIGTCTDLIKYHPKTKEIVFFNTNAPAPFKLFSQNITALLEDQNGKIWVGTRWGLNVIDAKGGVIERYLHERGNPNSLASNFIRSLYMDREGRIWVITGWGLSLFQANRNCFKRFQNRPGDPFSLKTNSIRLLLQEASNQYWIGNITGGLSKMHYFPELDSISCQHYYLQDAHEHSKDKMTINTLFIDEEKELWVGTYSRGLLRFDRQKQTLVPAWKEMPTIPNIAGILKDSIGCLWVSGNNGLWKIDPSNKKFLHFTYLNGLQSNQFNIGSFCKDKEGCFYFGGINGLNQFKPEIIGEPKMISKPIIIGVSKYGKQFCFDQPYNKINTIEIDYDQDFISFHFLSPEYSNPDVVQYYYKLEGFDTDWNFEGKNHRADYTNLPGGSYVFKVKARNEQGSWNPHEATLKVIVKPPFWTTSWFYLLVGLLSILLVIGIYQIRWQIKLQQIRNLNSIRERAAADFHDELGHRLTKISLFAETVFRLFPNMEKGIALYLEKIQANSNELYYSMRDFVWAMNPKNDSFFELAIALKDFGDELFDNTEIDFSTSELGNVFQQVHLEMDWKRHLMLIFKEAMHNSLKHSKCQTVKLIFTLEERQLSISLEDDGTGFIMDNKYQGYGLGNMKNRAEKIGGTLTIASQAGGGTKVMFIGEI